MIGETKIGVRVGDIMTRNFISVTPETSILDCAKIMVKKHVGSLVLKEKETLRGIITEKDIIWALTKRPQQELKKIKCSEISPRKLITIKPSADLLTALKLMQKSKFRRLPVVLNKKLIGLLTLKDILRIEPALFEIVKGQNALDIREEEEKFRRKKYPISESEGICEECGNYNFLEKVDSRLICQDCKEAM